MHRLYTGSTTAATEISNATSTLEPHLQVVERLSRATVVIVGLGGVGSWAAEAVCRSGVGGLVLIDLDDICISTNMPAKTAKATRVVLRKLKSSLGL